MEYPKILIVDSYGLNVKSLSQYLSAPSFSIEILTASDADTAIVKYRTEPIDLVIVDAFLRGKTTGFDLCRLLKSCPDYKAPIILLLSGYLFLERAKGMRSGADLLLHRPVVKEELLRMVRLLMGHKLAQPKSVEFASSPSAA